MGPTSLRYQLARTRHAVRRRLWAGKINQVYGDLVAGLDQAGFIERFRSYWSPFPTIKASKFLDLEVWLREAVFRALLLGLDQAPGKLRVFDLGAGAGYFLLVSRHLGHDVLGLDLDGEPLYNECFDFFGLPRLIQRIDPMTALPELPWPPDLVTAFMTSFNEYDDGRPWEAEPWRFFLEDLRSRLPAGGRGVIKFNLNPKTDQFYSPDLCRAIRSSRGFHARFTMDYLFLVAR
jgi:SAM-dependent methyltransferase